MSRFLQWILSILVMVLASFSAVADTVTVAVASNFAETAERLVRVFESSSAHRVRLIRGSSGRLYAQIINGAPIDVFLSADVERPRQLERRSLVQQGSRFTYAIGELVIWSRDPELDGKDCLTRLRQASRKKVAIANPLLAPYGAAAKEFLQQESIWEDLQPNLVFGENIAQAMQFTATGNASIGLVARSQIVLGGLPATSCMLPVPTGTHAPIKQDAVITRRAINNNAATAFTKFIRSEESREVIRQFGYLLPEIVEERP
ncbi:MAG: molybdate ABC transporter substrate-binding protein [Gammaproteobacteria bacterium]|nr:molybdate ABC transporter substrate-binding protein [Gammaproteobacteria bacterium]